ncbi:hypothetical protein AB0M44_06490 [Streptosporangium subroseum]|uniref:hypothetical protein n=1 Tax=Streptosporangium subroseum TaxID=106412 RepID=UPI00342108FB
MLLAVWSTLYLGGAALAADAADVVKVYVVRTAEQNGGTPDSLALIAARTLGDGNRAGEIFDLNRGRAQADGTALTNPGDLRPGWILRLPEDANGPDVQLAQESGGDGAAQPDGAASTAPDGAGTQPFVQGSQPPTQASNTIVLPLPAVLAGLGAFLLALLTAAIVARQQVRRLFAAMARAIRRLGDPVRRARRLRFRTSLAAAFAGDGESLRTAHGAVAELTGRKGHAVHAVSVDDAGVTAWVATADAPPAPWQDLGEARWRRPAGAFAPPTQPAYGTGSQLPSPSLVAVGVDEQGGKVFVDLSRLDGVLSVTGDPGVARDVVQGLLAEVARSKPAVPVAVLQTTGGPAVALPGTMRRIERFDPRPAGAPATAREAGTLRAAARLHPLEALLVASGTPTAQEAADLLALCGPGGAGWTALVCGDAQGAHWRWWAAPDGSVEIPLLRLTVTVPA